MNAVVVDLSAARHLRRTPAAISTYGVGDQTVVAVTGRVDAVVVPALKTVLVDLVADGHTSLVLDLTDVDTVDNSALAAMVAAHRRAHSLNGGLEIVCTQPAVLSLLHITGLDKVLVVHASLPDALDQ